MKFPPPSPISEGWKLVPVEPTHEMAVAADNDPLASCETGLDEYKALYAAMLAAAPTAPTTGSAPVAHSSFEVVHSTVEFEAYWDEVQVRAPLEFTHKEAAREIWMASRGIDYGRS